MMTCDVTTYFKIVSDPYHEGGMAMGSTLLAELAEIYMEYLKEMSLRYISLKPPLWFRYMDDMLILTDKIWKV